MATVRYTNIEGRVVAEKRLGLRRSYVPDMLGSTGERSCCERWRPMPRK
jgi:hypothetical protein